MATTRPFAGVLRECHAGKKTGAIFVSVTEASENLMRFYFRDGNIYSISYGAAKDGDCLDIIECYTPGKAVYLDGMKMLSQTSSSLPPTEDIIATVEKTGKQVQMDG